MPNFLRRAFSKDMWAPQGGITALESGIERAAQAFESPSQAATRIAQEDKATVLKRQRELDAQAQEHQAFLEQQASFGTDLEQKRFGLEQTRETRLKAEGEKPPVPSTFQQQYEQFTKDPAQYEKFVNAADKTNQRIPTIVRPHKVGDKTHDILFHAETGDMIKDMGEVPEDQNIADRYPVAIKNERGEVMGFYDRGSIDPVTGAKGKFNPLAPGTPTGARTSGLPAGQITQESLLDVMAQKVDMLEKIFPEVKGSIGPVSGRISGATGKLVDLPVNVQTMRRESKNISDMLLRARSGAQINEQEYQRMIALVPDPNQPSGNYYTNLQLFKKELAATMKARGMGAPAAQSGASQTKNDPLGIR